MQTHLFTSAMTIARKELFVVMLSLLTIELIQSASGLGWRRVFSWLVVVVFSLLPSGVKNARAFLFLHAKL